MLRTTFFNGIFVLKFKISFALFIKKSFNDYIKFSETRLGFTIWISAAFIADNSMI